MGEKLFLFFIVIAANCLMKGTSDIVMSEEIKIQIEPPETTATPTGYPPTILSSPSQLSILVGSSVVLPCRVHNLGNNVVIWKKGRTRALFAGRMKVTNDEKFSLTDRTFLQIEKVTPEYAGEYICQVNTKPPIELVHTVHILVSPSLTVDPEDKHVIVKEGDPALVRCFAEGYPTPVVTWRAIKGHLPGGVSEKQGSALAISSADIKHSGIYECIADNGVGEPAKAIIRIKVFYAPEISVNPLWHHAGEGSTVEFKCSAKAEPPPMLYWTRIPRKTLSDDPHIFLRNVTKLNEEQLVMKIRPVTEEHFGTYSCFANNSVGSAFRTVEISGLAEPVKFKSNSSGEETDSYQLSWTVKSYSPIIEYTLRLRPLKSRDSSARAPSWIDVVIPAKMKQSAFHSQNYLITGLEPGTGYEVVMQARNNFGWNHPSHTFTFYTSGGEQQSDEWEKSTEKEVTSLPILVTEIPLQMTGLDSNSEIHNDHSSVSSTISLAPTLIITLVLLFSII